MNNQPKKLNLFVQKLAKPISIVISLSCFIVLMLMVNIIFKQDFSYLTQTFNYTPEYAYQTLNDIELSGRTAHLLVLIPDLIMVALYTVLLMGANYAIYSKITSSCFQISFITFSPLILSLVQIIEIALLAILLTQYPNQMFLLAQLANYITMVKTILTVIFFLMPFVGLTALGIKRLIKRV